METILVRNLLIKDVIGKRNTLFIVVTASFQAVEYARKLGNEVKQVDEINFCKLKGETDNE